MPRAAAPAVAAAIEAKARRTAGATSATEEEKDQRANGPQHGGGLGRLHPYFKTCKVPTWRRETDIDATRYGQLDYACADGTVLRIAESYSSTGTRVWDTSIAMARLVERRRQRGEDADLFDNNANRNNTRKVPPRVLELGAGVGLLGMTLARLGADVVLTDLPAVVPHLERTVAANGLSHCAVRALDWRAPDEVLRALGRFDLVVASDVLICQAWAVALAGVVDKVVGVRDEDDKQNGGVVEVLIGTARGRDGIPHFEAAVREAGFDVVELAADAFDPDWYDDGILVYSLTRRPAASQNNRATPVSPP